MTRRWEVKLSEPELLKTVGSNATILSSAKDGVQ